MTATVGAATGVSATALLRTAGLAVRLWTAAGAPELFAALRAHDAEVARFATAASAAADRIGAELVPDPALTVSRRRQALAVRRALHRPHPPTDRDLDTLRALSADAAPGLAVELARLAEWAAALADADERLHAAVRAEQERLLPEAYVQLTACAAGRTALADGTVAAASDVPARLAAGEPWTTKRMRRRSEYLWRMIARGATKTTPRGWLGHLAVTGFAATDAEPGAALSDEVAVQRMGNLLDARHDGEVSGRRWWFQPLHRMDGDQVRLWFTDPDDPRLAGAVRVRATAPLLALRAALRDGARTADELAAAVLPPGAGAEARSALLVLLDRLTGLGVLETGRSPHRELTPWGPVRTAARDADYTDVHRRSSGAVAGVARARAWHRDLRQLLRLHHLMRTDRETASATTPPDSERPVLDILADRLAEMGRDGPRPNSYVESRWPTPADPGSGYAALVARLAAGDTRLDAATLDALAAPTVADGWPLDCTLRPLPDGTAVLDTVQPAGVYDARFADAVHDLHGPLAHTADYQDFLRRLDAATGVESVELLVPPLVTRAANSVRRPLYTTAWTGDPDLLTHCGPGTARHLPLDELVLRVDSGTRTVLHRGRPIRPVYHATRYPSPPWTTVYGVLMSGSPQQRCRVRGLRHSLGALPDAAHLPRLALGSLVLAPAQWRLAPSRLDGLRAGGLAAARAVQRLRTELGLPRWTFVSPDVGGKPVACDLESVRAATVLSDLAAAALRDGSPALVVEEMLPDPDALTVHDHLDGQPAPVAAELLVRFGAGHL